MAFIPVMRKLHDKTKVHFLVNKLISGPIEMKSGIRQDCPIAPFLFILTADALALATTQDPDL